MDNEAKRRCEGKRGRSGYYTHRDLAGDLDRAQLGDQAIESYPPHLGQSAGEAGEKKESGQTASSSAFYFNGVSFQMAVA